MSNINTVYPVNSTDTNNSSIPRANSFYESEINDLHGEEERAISNSKERLKSFMKIVNGDSLENVSIEHLFTGFTGILMILVIASIYTLLPWNDAIKNPQYFYESLLVFCLAFVLNFASEWIMMFSYAINIQRFRTFQFLYELWIILIVSSCITFGILNIIWIYVLNFLAPVPLNGYLLYLNGGATILFTIWFRLPTEWHQDKSFRKRLRYFLIGVIYCVLHVVNYAVMTSVLQSVPRNYQWIAALFSPLIREFNIWFSLKFFAKSAKGDMVATNIFWTMDFGISHANFLALTN